MITARIVRKCMNLIKKAWLRTIIATALCTICMVSAVFAAGPGDNVIDDGTKAKMANHPSATAYREDTASAETATETKTQTADLASGTKGQSLGMFTTTGYCNCSRCSGGHNLTYSGTVPMASHTISADIDIFPIGTRLMIDDIIYTVEDIGSGVDGNKLDIYYASHADAVAHGMKTQEVFAVE